MDMPVNQKAPMSGVLVTLNVVVALFMLFPLLYAVSVSLMTGSELFTMDMNLIPRASTLENYLRAWAQVPLLRFILNSFIVAGCITLGRSSPARWQPLPSRF